MAAVMALALAILCDDDARADALWGEGAGSALVDIPAAAAARFGIGAAIFTATWLPAPDVSDGADGLGPLYNAVSCAQCHPVADAPGGRNLPAAAQSVVAKVVRLERDASDGRGDPHYGRQLQDRAVAGLAPEGRFDVQWLESAARLSDGTTISLRRPEVRLQSLSSGPLAAGTHATLRRPPPLAGLGLVAAIADEEIAAWADPLDRNGDGIGGRVAWAIDAANGDNRVGRFGWKASSATLAAQTADALSLDMGLSSPLAGDPAGDCTVEQVACRSAPDGRSAAKAGHEVSAQEIALLVAYLEGLAPPPVVESNDAHREGREHFERLGCGGCHRARFVTRQLAQAPHLSGKVLAPFSDFLLHDMGADLAMAGDGASLDERSWRTAPLWGLGRRLGDIARGDIDGLMHDGRARTIEEAILWHGGEGAGARDAYRNLPAAARSTLIAYLSGL